MRRLARLLLPVVLLSPVATVAVQVASTPAAHADWVCTEWERGWECYWF